jgi:hypothetical protein
MYDFAVVALLALAVVKTVDFLSDQFNLAKFRSILTFLAGIGGAWLLDYSVFAGWGIPIRDADVGVLVTGFVVAGMTVPWRAMFGWLTHERATMDETLGDHSSLRRAA